jgi:hypothetical protein
MKLVNERETVGEDDVDEVRKENEILALEMVICVWF